MLIAKIVIIVLGILLILGGIMRTPKQHRSTDYTVTGDTTVGCFTGILLGLFITFLPWSVVRILWILFGIGLIYLGLQIPSS